MLGSSFHWLSIPGATILLLSKTRMSRPVLLLFFSQHPAASQAHMLQDVLGSVLGMRAAACLHSFVCWEHPCLRRLHALLAAGLLPSLYCTDHACCTAAACAEAAVAGGRLSTGAGLQGASVRLLGHAAAPHVGGSQGPRPHLSLNSCSRIFMHASASLLPCTVMRTMSAPASAHFFTCGVWGVHVQR